MNKFTHIALTPILIFLFLSANILPANAAGTLKIGQECNTDDQCITEECEESAVDKPGTTDKKKYCVCDVKEHCSAQYGGNPDDWSCSNGATATFDLNYCLREKNPLPDKTENVKAPIGFTGASVIDALLDPSAATAATVSEIKQITQAPQPKINIPGLSFTDPTSIKTVTENGSEFLYIPFLGEYIAAIYRYTVVAAGVVAVIILIISGLQWMFPGNIITSGSGEQKKSINQAKKRIAGAVTGLIIAVGSYTLLYTINPNLVEFKSLRISTITGELLGDGHEEDEEKLGDPAEFQIAKTCSPDDTGITSFPKDGDASQLNPIFKKIDGKWRIDCSQFGQCSAGIAACWNACLTQLPGEKRTTAIPGYNQTYLGRMDCNTGGGGAKRSRGSINTIVLHEGFGSGALTHWWFTHVKKGIPVSSHYMVGADGQIYQIMDELFTASHTATGGYNSKSIGIDLQFRCLSKTQAAAAGISVAESCYYTEKQYKAISQLISDIRGRGTPITNIIGHCEVQGNRSDPRNFDWSELDSNNASHAAGCPTFQEGAEKKYNDYSNVCCIQPNSPSKTVKLNSKQTIKDAQSICQKNNFSIGVPGQC